MMIRNTLLALAASTALGTVAIAADMSDPAKTQSDSSIGIEKKAAAPYGARATDRDTFYKNDGTVTRSDRAAGQIVSGQAAGDSISNSTSRDVYDAKTAYEQDREASVLRANQLQKEAGKNNKARGGADNRAYGTAKFGSGTVGSEANTDANLRKDSGQTQY